MTCKIFTSVNVRWSSTYVRKCLQATTITPWDYFKSKSTRGAVTTGAKGATPCLLKKRLIYIKIICFRHKFLHLSAKAPLARVTFRRPWVNLLGLISSTSPDPSGYLQAICACGAEQKGNQITLRLSNSANHNSKFLTHISIEKIHL